MPKYLGRGQIAECQRSGIKCKASELVRDGRNPQLLVLPEWADPAHPQERPYQPDDVEGLPRFAVAPENVPSPVASVLTAQVAGDDVTLTWPAFAAPGLQIAAYEVFRALGAGAFAVVTTLVPDYDSATALRTGAVPYGSPYVDQNLAAASYRYFVRGATTEGTSADTNTLTAVVP